MIKKNDRYGKKYGKVLSLANKGYNAEHISYALSVPLWIVYDIEQVGYGRSLQYGSK